MSKKIAKNRKHTTIAILTMAISSISVFLAMPNSTANAQEVLRITKIEPQPITVGDRVLVKGIIENPTKIKVVEITSPNCGNGEVKARLNSSSKEWSANYRFLKLREWVEPHKGECEIKAIGKDNTDPSNVTLIDTSSFYVEVQEADLIKQVREISDEISSGKDVFFWIGVVEVLVILIALWLIFTGHPNIQKKLTEIDNNVKDITPSSRHLLPHIKEIVPNEAELGNTVTISGENLDDEPEVLLRGISGDIRDIKCNLTAREYDKIEIQLPCKLLIGQELLEDFRLIVKTAGGSAMRPFRLLNPTLKVNKPNAISANGGWYELTGEGFTVETEVFDVDNNNPIEKGYMDSSKLIVKWPAKDAKTKKKVEIRRKFGQPKQLELEIEYST